MDPQQAVGFANFLHETDTLGASLLGLLLGMSIVTWSLIVTRMLAAMQTRARTKRFLQTFTQSSSIGMVEEQLEQRAPDEPFSRVTHHALRAAQHCRQHPVDRLNGSCSDVEFLTRAMRRAIDEETTRSESGLTVLASIGATAPFIGLFGTVWGIYHALIAIGIGGQATIDKVAGPVGEALIMTALGLAVAIPAVLGYNFFVRSKRLLVARLDSFAHDLFTFVMTGSQMVDRPTVRSIDVVRPARGAT